jgi:outer membrane biosynthesis protein TonB
MSDAYKWLHTLPASGREEMKSMEQVVSLYIRTKRLGQNVPSKEDVENYRPPVVAPNPQDQKSQEFQRTLKGLRTELDGFDFDNNQTPQAPPQVSPTPPKQEFKYEPKFEPRPEPKSEPKSEIRPEPENAPPVSSGLRMDPRSRQIVNEIRESLNLSSDAEVLRMSLVLAKKALQSIL